MRRVLIGLTLAAWLSVASVAFAGGGQAPGTGDTVAQNRPVLVGTFLIDPHQGMFFGGPPVTPTAKQGSAIFLYGSRSANVLFNVPVGTTFHCGCDATLTLERFLKQPVNVLVEQPTLDRVLEELNVTPPPNGELFISGIVKSDCLNDPNLAPENVDPVTGQIVTLPEPLESFCTFGGQFVQVGGDPPPPLDGHPGAGILLLQVRMQFRVPAP